MNTAEKNRKIIRDALVEQHKMAGINARNRRDAVKDLQGKLTAAINGVVEFEALEAHWAKALATHDSEGQKWEVIVSHYTGEKPIHAIKMLRDYAPRLGLKEAKDWVEMMMQAPISPALIISTTPDRNAADTICGLLRAEGFKADIRSAEER